MLAKIIKQSEDVFSRKNKVVKTEIKSLNNDCEKYLSEINKRMESCVCAFNGLALEISELMVKTMPHDTEAKRGCALFKKLIRIKPLEPISMFIDKVYCVDEYRISIKTGDESFFLDNEHKDVTQNDRDKMNTMFRFKTCWKELDIEIRDSIKNMMKVLVSLTSKYIEEMDNGNEIAVIMKTISSKY